LPQLPLASPHLIPRRIVTTSTSSPAPIDVPKLIVAPGSPHHNSLTSFLEYASRQKMDRRSTVYVGTHYEYIVSESLLRLGFSLFRTGGRADRGIDLLGHWVLPTLREPLPVVVQCKSLDSVCNPAHIRELEGSFQGTPAKWRNKDVLGLLVTTQNASRGVLESLGSSRWPLGFIKISRRGTIEQCLWNAAAQARGLEGVGVTVRYTPLVLLAGAEEGLEEEDLPPIINGKRKRRKRVPEKFRIAGAKKDIQLTWMGSPIFPEREGLDQETIKLMDIISHDSREPTKKTSTTATAPKALARTKAKSSAQTKAKTTAKPKPILTTTPPPTKTPRGRPPGSPDKPSIPSPTPRKRGRPKGSKNK
ncbi:hypothetical protein K458DRAFT_283299, partial [Lentithecium fluviatile CBS 122367]